MMGKYGFELAKEWVDIDNMGLHVILSLIHQGFVSGGIEYAWEGILATIILYIYIYIYTYIYIYIYIHIHTHMMMRGIQ